MKKKMVVLFVLLLALTFTLAACSDTVISYAEAKEVYTNAGYQIQVDCPDMKNPDGIEAGLLTEIKNIFSADGLLDNIKSLLMVYKAEDDYTWIVFCTTEAAAEQAAAALEGSISQEDPNIPYTGGTRLTVAAIGVGSAPLTIVANNA